MPLDRHSINVVQVRVTWDGKAPTTVYMPYDLLKKWESKGYGGSDVEDYLSDQHGYRVKAWEVVE